MTIPVHPSLNSKKQSGSATLWAIIWLMGMAALAYFCLIRHVPTLELATESRISQALTAASATGVAASVNGYTATLTGTAQNETQKEGFLALAAGTPGVKSVVDEVSVSDAGVATANDDTPIVGKPIKLEPVSEQVTETTNAAEADTTTSTASSTDTELATTAAITTEAVETPETETSETAEASDTAENNPAPAKAVEDEAVEAETAPAEEPVDQTVAAINNPSLKLEVDDGTLMLDGQIAISDNLRQLIDQAKSSLNIDFISNSAQAKDDTKPATWLEPITALIPAMAPLDKPGISIVKNQITLQGVAPDQSTHDAVITRALQLLGDYSLVERIDIVEAEPKSIEKLSESIDETITETEQTAKAEQTADAVEAVIEPAAEPVAEPASDTVADAQAQVSTEPTTIETNADLGTNIRDAFELLPSSRILFRSGSSILTADSLDVLDTIAQLLREYPNAKMDIDGHTDSQGDSEINLKLSQLRANAVRDYLVDQGISVYRLTAYGFGEGMPIAKNDSPEGRALNRRIEFKF